MAHQRAVIVAGARTPFVKAFGPLLKVDSIGLGVSSVAGLLNNTKLDPNVIDNLIWGNVVLQTSAPNIAREIVIDLNLPKHVVAHSTSMACSSGMNAAIQAATLIEGGHADVIIAGGSDSMSNAEVPLPRDLVYGAGMAFYNKKKGVAAVKEVYKYAGAPGPRWLPTMPAVAERSTGKTMGWHADLMADMNHISRADQDAFALRSHQNAAAAADKGFLDQEVVPTESNDKDGNVLKADTLIKRDMDLAKISGLRTAFRKAEQGGTITAASSSALTDGGSAMLFMSEARAKALGYPTDISIKSWSLTAIDPMPQLLMAPALGIVKALDKAKLTVADIDVWEIHEAFAAQVLATLKCITSVEFCNSHLNGHKPLDPIPHEKLNVNGGSIALGHPFAATGGRVITAAMNQLRRTQKRYALVSICAAGGIGSVCILERKQ